MSAETLESAVERIAALGYGVDIDRSPRGSVRVPLGSEERRRGAGARWSASLTRGSTRYPAGFGESGVEAVNAALEQARRTTA